MGAARDHASKSLLWSSVDTFSQTGFSILALVLIARLLPVAEVGIGTFAIMIVQLITMPFELWFHDALVQRKDLQLQHLSTAFTMTLVGSMSVALALCVIAPWLAMYSGKPHLTAMLRVASLAIPVAGIASVLSAMLRRELQFAPLARRTLIGRTVGVVIGVVAAWAGVGAWALVIMYMSSTVLSTIVLLMNRSSKLSLRCSGVALRELLGFAAPNMLAQLLLLANGRLFVVLSGFYISDSALGCLSLAFRLVEELRNTLSSAAAQVALPLLAKRAQQPESFAAVLSEATCFTSSILLPLYAGMFVTASDLITSLFGVKWYDAVSVMEILALASVIVTLRQYSSVALNALGLPMMNVKINGFVFACSILLLSSGWVNNADTVADVWLWRGVLLLITSVIGMRWAAAMSIATQLVPNLPALIASAIMAVAIILVQHSLLANQSAGPRLAISIVVGVALYVSTLLVISPQLLKKLAGFMQTAMLRRSYGTD